MAACIPRTKATKRVALSALMAWSGRALPGLVDPHRAPAGCRAIPAQEVGGHLEENAPAVGRPRDAQVTERLRDSLVLMKKFALITPALSGVVSLSAGRYIVETICGDSGRINPNKHRVS